ncbi:MAG: FecR domain-containing protein, partial [Lachnospiraceae bacterium]|nr:FecR domain-containing protein [Lachnospiraceae bacterium]
MQEKKLSTKAIVGIVVGVLAILAVILVVILMNKNKLTAMVMRLIRQEGEVALLDASGQDVVIMDNMKLYSGNALQTGSDGLVDLSLDDTKYLTIENQSQVVFEKSGKALELKLNSGRLFFNVTEKLADDETMDISTSTMVVGIRGTSGWVDAENSDLYIGDGTVRVKGINPKTGETIEAEFTAGQKVHVYLLDEDGKTVAFELENYTIEDVPREMLRNIVQYPELFLRFVEETGFEPKAVIREAIIKKILPEEMNLPEEYEELLEEVLEEMKEPEEEEEEEPEEVEEVETPTTNRTVTPQNTQEEEPPAEEQPAQQSSTPAATTPTTYTVTVNTATGGTASASANSATEGTAITLT